MLIAPVLADVGNGSNHGGLQISTPFLSVGQEIPQEQNSWDFPCPWAISSGAGASPGHISQKCE